MFVKYLFSWGIVGVCSLALIVIFLHFGADRLLIKPHKMGELYTLGGFLWYVFAVWVERECTHKNKKRSSAVNGSLLTFENKALLRSVCRSVAVLAFLCPCLLQAVCEPVRASCGGLNLRAHPNIKSMKHG